MALSITLKQDPRDYMRAIISMLPKQVDFDHTVTRVTEIDRVIAAIEEKIALAEQQEAPLMIEHEHVRRPQ